MNAELEQFKKERNEAFLSLDETKIRTFHQKWNPGRTMPGGDVFWGGVHKAITGNLQLPKEFRQKSKDWLTAKGLQSLDDGDLH